MNRARNRIQRALALLQSGVLDIWNSDEVSGRLKRLWENLRHHPYLVTSITFLTTNFPIWKTRYHESREFKDRVWYTGIFGIFLVIVLYFSIGEGPEVPMFKVKEDEIHFKKGAPQLAFIRAEPVSETPLPVGAPIPARVTMDDSRTTPVHPSLSGRVVQQHAQLGDRVEAGDPLVTIDSPDYGTALTDWHKADADAKRKKAHFQRARELLAGEAIARRDYEVAEADSKIADAEAKRAYLRIANLVPYGQPAPDSERLTLRAPISGVVAHINVNPGREVRADHPDPVVIRLRLGACEACEVLGIHGVDHRARLVLIEVAAPRLGLARRRRAGPDLPSLDGVQAPVAQRQARHLWDRRSAGRSRWHSRAHDRQSRHGRPCL